MITDADLAFLNGPVHLGDAARSRAGGLAVRDGRVVAVGAHATRELVGPGTEVVDLAGRLLVPGFQDAHVHPIQGGLQLAACDLSGARTPGGYVELVQAYARSHPEVGWITGGGWGIAAFGGGWPTRAALDAVVPDRPVCLYNADHHGVWVNSAALAVAGITAATPDPPDGRIERDGAGEPTGMLQEGAANLVRRHVPSPTAAQLRDALVRAQALLHSLGITAWQDALVGSGLGMPDIYRTYVDAAAAGELTARVEAALWWSRSAGLDQLDRLLERRITVGRFRAGTVKMMLDGIAENHTAAMLESYVDGCRTAGCDPTDPAHGLDTTGLSFIDPAALPGYVTALDAAGFSVHFHALGDRAVRDALDAVAAARTANGWSDARHQAAHLQVVHPDDRPRFRALGVAANIQALWAAHEPQMDELTIPFLGERRASWQYPFGDLLRHGAVLAAGSDWPVSSPDPWQAMHVAVNRTPPGVAGRPFLPGQALDLGSALAAYTAGSAWANRLDDTGVLRVGAEADLVLLDRDPFAAPPDEIASTRVTETFVAGIRVHPA